MIRYLHVIPHEGIGPLKLGMSPQEILIALERLRTEWISQHAIDISKDSYTDGDLFTLRYQDGSSFFMVQYKDNKSAEIAVDNEIRDIMIVDLFGMDVFKTTVESLVSNLKKYSICSYDEEDELLGTNYEFQDIGIRLWREEAFHPKLLSDKSYIREMGNTIAEMYQYQYFQIIAVN